MIPTYNQAEFIAEAVMSALGQCYENLEVVVGDDASTDSTEAIVSAIDDSRLRYIRHPRNLGRVGNYRKLLYEFVTGDYVVNLDGDDYYTDNEFISQAIDVLTTTDRLPLMVAARVRTGTDGPPSDLPDCESIDGLEILKRLPRKEFALMHMAVLYSVADAKRIGFYRSATNSSDWESLYRLAALGRVAYLDRNVGVWRQHGGNQTAIVDAQTALENLKIWRPIYENGVLHGLSRLQAATRMNQCIAHYALRSLVDMSTKGNRKLLSLLLQFAGSFPMGFAFLVCNPKSLKRLISSLAGVDRRDLRQ